MGRTNPSSLSLTSSLKAAVLAAVLAALCATAWHSVVTEPVIDAAIELEEARHSSGAGDAEQPMVSRNAQRWGLGLALMLYGLSWALALGGVFALSQGGLPGGSAGWRAALLALATFSSVALLPFLKYPPNPPGVGDPETIATRQVLYFGLLALAVLGAGAAFVLERRLATSGRPSGPIAFLVYAAYCALLYVALPPNPDPVAVPADLMSSFRLRSGVGLALYWAMFIAAFVWLVQRWTEPRGRNALSSPRQPAVPSSGD